VFVTVEDIFPGTKADERTLLALLERLSRDDTLFNAARVNTLITGPGDFDAKGRQQAALGTYWTPEQVERINDFARRHPGSGTPFVFFAGQLRELVRWTARYAKNLPGDGDTFKDPEVRERFVKAALIASTLWSNRTYGDKLSAEGEVAEVRMRALGALRKGIEETNLGLHLGVAIGRGIALFTRYLPKHYPGFAEEFERKTGLTIHQYLGCVTVLATYAQQRSTTGPLFISQTVAAETAYRAVFPRFFALEAQSPEAMAQSLWTNFETLEYRALRERPIMIVEDGRGMILDPTFFVERLSIGALFHVAGGMGRQESNRLFGSFGDAFEEYATDFLRRMYPSRPGLVDRVAFGVIGRDGQGKGFEIDTSVIDVKRAAIMEIKAAFLSEAAIADPNPETLLNEIRSKYGAAQGKGERGKGVAQLARSIGAIIRGEWEGPNGEFAGMTTLYPVLVVHDGRLDAPALGNFLEADFRALLGPVPEGKHVAPLTIMTIQDLENLEKSVSAFGLLDLLADYSRECPDRMRSLHNYTVYSPYAQKIAPSDFLIESSMKVLEVLKDELFPKPKPKSKPKPRAKVKSKAKPKA
jgi:hypothetical protein